MSPTASSNPSASDIRVKNVGPEAILCWLSLGWQDLRSAGIASLIHGLIVSLFSLAITAITLVYWELLPGAVSGFVLVGPFLATGLFALSSRIERDLPTSLQDAINAWRLGSRYLFVFGSLLLLAASGWVLFSAVMFHFFIEVDIEHPLDFLIHVITQDNHSFLLWTILGGLGSALAFAITVGGLPLLIERDIDTREAIHASIRAVSANPQTMVVWAMTILLFTGLSFITLMLGFIILYPLLGHASWYAYRDLIDANALPLRNEFPANG